MTDTVQKTRPVTAKELYPLPEGVAEEEFAEIVTTNLAKLRLARPWFDYRKTVDMKELGAVTLASTTGLTDDEIEQMGHLFNGPWTAEPQEFLTHLLEHQTNARFVVWALRHNEADVVISTAMLLLNASYFTPETDITKCSVYTVDSVVTHPLHRLEKNARAMVRALKKHGRRIIRKALETAPDDALFIKVDEVIIGTKTPVTREMLLAGNDAKSSVIITHPEHDYMEKLMYEEAVFAKLIGDGPLCLPLLKGAHSVAAIDLGDQRFVTFHRTGPATSYAGLPTRPGQDEIYYVYGNPEGNDFLWDATGAVESTAS